MTDREALHVAVGTVLTNVTNFPEKVQARLLGQDMAPLIARVTDAVTSAGFSRPKPTDKAIQVLREAVCANTGSYMSIEGSSTVLEAVLEAVRDA